MILIKSTCYCIRQIVDELNLYLNVCFVEEPRKFDFDINIEFVD